MALTLTPTPCNRLQLQLVLHRLHSLVRAGPAALHNLRLAVELHVAGMCMVCVHVRGIRAWYIHGRAARGRCIYTAYAMHVPCICHAYTCIHLRLAVELHVARCTTAARYLVITSITR